MLVTVILHTIVVIQSSINKFKRLSSYLLDKKIFLDYSITNHIILYDVVNISVKNKFCPQTFGLRDPKGLRN